MQSSVIIHITRFILLFLLQVLLLKRIDLTAGSFDYIHLFIYPLAIMVLPIQMNKSLLLCISFIYGICIDMFYNSPGVHAGALVLMGYFRGHLLGWIKPYEGYNAGDEPKIDKLGLTWFLTFSSILLIVHHFTYFSLEAFSFIYIFDITLNTIFSMIPTFILIILIQVLFKSRY